MAALGRGGSSPLPRTTSEFVPASLKLCKQVAKLSLRPSTIPPFNLTFGRRLPALPNCWGCTVCYGRVAELVYATDLKSVESNLVRVQVPPRPPFDSLR